MSGALRHLLIATIVASVAAEACAGGAFDGTWTGGAKRGTGTCHETQATVSIAGGRVTGTMLRHSGSVQPVTGSIAADGSFDGKVGDAHLTGKFDGSAFSGSYNSSDCGSRVFTLNRS